MESAQQPSTCRPKTLRAAFRFARPTSTLLGRPADAFVLPAKVIAVRGRTAEIARFAVARGMQVRARPIRAFAARGSSCTRGPRLRGDAVSEDCGCIDSTRRTGFDERFRSAGSRGKSTRAPPGSEATDAETRRLSLQIACGRPIDRSRGRTLLPTTQEREAELIVLLRLPSTVTHRSTPLTMARWRCLWRARRPPCLPCGQLPCVVPRPERVQHLADLDIDRLDRIEILRNHRGVARDVALMIDFVKMNEDHVGRLFGEAGRRPLRSRRDRLRARLAPREQTLRQPRRNPE